MALVRSSRTRWLIPPSYPIFQRVAFLVEASLRVDLRYRSSEFRAHTDASYASTICCIEGAWHVRGVVRVHRPGFPAVCPVGAVGLRLVVFQRKSAPPETNILKTSSSIPRVFLLSSTETHLIPIYKWPCFRNSSVVWRMDGGATARSEPQTSRIRSHSRSVFPSPPGPAKMSIISGSLTPAATKDM